jgi:hypothetical protein
MSKMGLVSTADKIHTKIKKRPRKNENVSRSTRKNEHRKGILPGDGPRNSSSFITNLG